MRFGRRDGGGSATIDEAVRNDDVAAESVETSNSNNNSESRRQESSAPAGSGEWRGAFLEKLSQAQNRWVRRFEDLLESAVGPVFEEMKTFLADNGFHISTPLRESGRRSYKFELAENAYLLVIFRSLGVGEFEARCEHFVPGFEPAFKKSLARIADVNESWARKLFQGGLDNFIEQLSGDKSSNVS